MEQLTIRLLLQLSKQLFKTENIIFGAYFISLN